MLWLIIARDGTDPEAPARRQAAREHHLAALRPHAEGGGVPFAGAMLADDGTMIGSMIVMEAEDEAAARARIDADPYTAAGVWQTYEIHGFKRAF